MSFATISMKSRVPGLLLLAALAACSKQEDAAAPAPAGTPSAAPTAAPAAETATTSAAIQTMNVDQLREAANKALGENRIYAPGGDNAVEYYLAVRDKQPDDATVASALTDLQPYLVIAAEQSIAREDFAESQRLAALIEKIDAKAPALPRLKQSIASTQEAASKRSAAEEAKAQERIKQQEEQRKAQQEEQQRQAAAVLAAQQEEARTRAAADQAAAEKAAAERAAAEQREREAAFSAAAATAPAAPATPPAAQPAAPALRLVSSPPPRYPPEALRAGTAGEVLVEFTVNPDGSVDNARVVRSTPARVFDREAVNAVRRWKFAPIPAPTTTRRTINFQPGN
ncbi:MAG: energy transducer TonB [Pseudoxanthomonas sp.]